MSKRDRGVTLVSPERCGARGEAAGTSSDPGFGWLRRGAVATVAAALAVMGLTPTVAAADVAERCSGPVSAGPGATYRTCIFATPETVRARTVLRTLRICPVGKPCGEPYKPRLYVELYRDGTLMVADAVTFDFNRDSHYEAVVYYPNRYGSTERYRSQGRASTVLTSVRSPDIIV